METIEIQSGDTVVAESYGIRSQSPQHGVTTHHTPPPQSGAVPNLSPPPNVKHGADTSNLSLIFNRNYHTHRE